MTRTLVIGLDGYEISLAEQMIAHGQLPHMARLREQSARYELDHGRAKYSGLAWEHISTARTPEALNRFAAVDLDPETYRVKQRPTQDTPVFQHFEHTRTVVFDLPYCDLRRVPKVQGLTTWGAHDPGVQAISNPTGLHHELDQRFGPYPATDYIYGFVWPDPEETQIAGQKLREAVRQRTRCASWLLQERLPDWDLAMVTVSEAHSGIEMLWHGIDPEHVLKSHPSARPAGEQIRGIYQEIDQLIGQLADTFPDAQLLVIAMHGMGRNDADLASMVLLPELLHRKHFQQPYMREGVWQNGPDGQAQVPTDFSWHHAMEAAIAPLWEFQAPQNLSLPFNYQRDRDYQEIEWLPATRYQPFWPRMQVFALPAFYDSRLRVNLIGREAHGIVALDQYNQTLLDVIELLHDCRDAVTGEPVLGDVYPPRHGNHPAQIDPSGADLEFTWRSAPTGLTHPDLGTIGPVPYRRPGGHTGKRGFAWFRGQRWQARDHGQHSAFNVMPTLARLHGEENALAHMSGTPLI